MVQTDKLKWEMRSQGLTEAQVAWHLGISEQCFCRKLETGRFGTQDMQLLRSLLHLERPEDIFFA